MSPRDIPYALKANMSLSSPNSKMQSIPRAIREVDRSSKISARLAIISGITLGLGIGVLGLWINYTGHLNQEPYGAGGLLVLVISLGTTLGYHLGSAMKTESVENRVFIFWSAFLATFAALIGILSAYSVYVAGSFVGPGLFAPLTMGLFTIASATLIVSGVVVHMKRFKDGLDQFSNKFSGGIFAGYGTASIFTGFDPFWGAAFGVLVGLLTVSVSTSMPEIRKWLEASSP
jgi:hypothetical protein